MPEFCIDKRRQAGGEYLVHQSFPDKASNVDHLPDVENTIDLDYFDSCEEALDAARSKFGNDRFDGCVHCCPDCSTSFKLDS